MFHFTLIVQILVGGGTPTKGKKCNRHFEFPREVSIYNLESPLMRFLRLWRTRSKRRKQYTSLRGTKQSVFHFTLTVQILVGGGTPTKGKKGSTPPPPLLQYGCYGTFFFQNVKFTVPVVIVSFFTFSLFAIISE